MSSRFAVDTGQSSNRKSIRAHVTLIRVRTSSPLIRLYHNVKLHSTYRLSETRFNLYLTSKIPLMYNSPHSFAHPTSCLSTRVPIGHLRKSRALLLADCTKQQPFESSTLDSVLSLLNRSPIKSGLRRDYCISSTVSRYVIEIECVNRRIKCVLLPDQNAT